MHFGEFNYTFPVDHFCLQLLHARLMQGQPLLSKQEGSVISDMEKGEACNHSISIKLSQLVFHRGDLEMHVCLYCLNGSSGVKFIFAIFNMV